MKFTAIVLLATTAAARHHHHHHHEYVQSEVDLNSMSETKLISSLRTTLDQALELESRDDKAAAVAKTLKGGKKHGKNGSRIHLKTHFYRTQTLKLVEMLCQAR